LTFGLRFGHRTVAYKMEVFDKVAGFWYLRLRHREHMVNAIDGIVKIERLALTAEEREDGLETSIVLLNSIQQRTSRKVAIFIFNVKGKDLCRLTSLTNLDAIGLRSHQEEWAKGGLSVTETSRRLKIPVRDYLCSILPGLANFPINRIAELTPASWLGRN
jgi:hypothetical protein